MSEAATQDDPVHLPAPAARVGRINLRWIIAAIVIGAVSAFAAAMVRLSFRGLEWVLTGSLAAPPVAGAHLPLWRRALTPVLGALLASVVLSLRKRHAKRHGRDPRPFVEYVEAVRRRHGRIPLVPNCWRTLSAACSVASGAAVGREGSMIQFAAAGASTCGRWLQGKLGGEEPLDLSMLVAFGVAGGVTTAYNAPIAGMFFASEIVLGNVQLHELPLMGLASAAGWGVSGVMLGFKELYPARVPVFSHPWGLLLLPVLAGLFGLVGPVYQRLIRSLSAARKLPLALVWASVVVGLVSLIDPRVWGNGDLGLSAALGRAELPGLSIAAPALGLLLVLRLVSTTACVGTGTVGGVFTPTLFAGAAIGALVAHLVPTAPSALWAIAGMSALMAAVTHAPLMAAFMAVELTGDWPMLPVLIVMNVISWQIAARMSRQALYAIATQAPVHSAPRQARPGAGYNQPRTV